MSWILGLTSCLAIHSHHQWKNSENLKRKEKNKVEEMKKYEEQVREKERKEFDLNLALEVSKNVFCTKMTLTN